MREVCRTLPVVYKTRTDDKALSVRAVLSSGERDQAGELVYLDGLDFTSHERNPWVDVEHTGTLVGWGRKSLATAGAPYSVQKARLNFGTATAPVIRDNVPIGTTFFDPSDRIQVQTFALVKSNALPGVSLEFRPKVRKAAPNPWSELEKRQAFDYEQVDVLRWTLCARPVCESALTEDVTKAVRDDALSRVLRDRRIHTGAGYEELHPVLFKALSAANSTRTTVSLGKSMDPNAQTETIYDETPDNPSPEMPEGPPAKPTVQTHYDVAQGLIDLCDQARAQLESSEHMKGKNYLLKLLDKMEAIAEDAKANGDKIDGELAGKDGSEESASEESASEEENASDETDDADMERDEEGTLKAIRPVYARVLKARRFKAVEISAGLKAAQDAERQAAEAELALARAEEERAAKLLRRREKVYG